MLHNRLNSEVFASFPEGEDCIDMCVMEDELFVLTNLGLYCLVKGKGLTPVPLSELHQPVPIRK